MDFIGAYSPDNLMFLVDGFWITLKVAAISIVLSFIIGGILGILRYADIPVVSKIVAGMIEVIRNLPLLLIIFFVYFALPEIGIKFSIEASAIIALTVFESAMLAEIIRSGLNSVPKGQIEAGRSSGLSYIQTLWHIVLPQGIKKMVPPIVSQFISLLKDTSLATVIALPDLMHNAQVLNAQSINYIVPIFILVALMYFVVNYILSIVTRRLELKAS
ncbi:amino acid ABC transporter permease [Ureibacillus sinduriensis]|uniref:Glutamine ABC transporter permease n=1 Tax=Ureibacillus sinduriensis BLB-1 = JCM 15800 TaxID=1384057 RepID=A0A0A3I0M0_9BACL|nr:amino acid ABC transporter permease [Ureibacillus sinduriensis]KGR77055.1 glutamine ABC transporter permease [Ureibacillus sinduriensis BLB-1 = JCM 15800]